MYTQLKIHCGVPTERLFLAITIAQKVVVHKKNLQKHPLIRLLKVLTKNLKASTHVMVILILTDSKVQLCCPFQTFLSISLGSLKVTASVLLMGSPERVL